MQVLDINASKLDTRYKAAMARESNLHRGIFQPSFLVPADPLSCTEAEEVQRMECAQCKKAPVHSMCVRCKVGTQQSLSQWLTLCLGKPCRHFLVTDYFIQQNSGLLICHCKHQLRTAKALCTG